MASLFSNVPVVGSFPSFEERKNAAVVFGTAGRREAVYRNAEKVNTCCKVFGITSIIDIGDGYNKEWAQSLSIPVVVKERLEASEVADHLKTCKYGFISYPENIFGKSGIFSAYAGNAMCIVNFDPSAMGAKDGLVENQHYINAISLENKSSINPAELSFQIFNWYQPRSIEAHAKIVGDVLLQDGQ